MPGIVGIFNKHSPQENRADIYTMLECSKHEAFYNAGVYINEEKGIYLGWTSPQGSYSDCMPIWNKEKNVCIFFSGEHYANTDTVSELKNRGCRFNENNASILSCLYDAYGESFYEHLNGWFSGVVVDLRNDKITLFNDRYGLNRIYYRESHDAFSFASEAKSLLKIFPDSKSLNPNSFGEYLACGCTLQDRSLFKDIFLLPCASNWEIQPGRPVSKKTYFDRSVWESQEPLPAEEYYSLLHETWQRIVPRYVKGPQAVGLSVTGGLDSRMIAAYAKPSELPCYTFGGMYRECTDVSIGREIAHAGGQKHQVIPLDKSFFSQCAELAQDVVYYTDGTMDSTGAVGLYVNRLARQIAPIRLTGNYGGEVLRTLFAMSAGKPSSPYFSREIEPEIERAVRTFYLEKEVHPKSFILFKQMPWHHFSRFCLEQSQLTIRSPYLDNELAALSYRAPDDLDANRDFMHRITRDGNIAMDRIPTDRGGHLDPTLPQKIKRFFGEKSFLAEYVWDYGMPHWLCRIDKTVDFLHLENLFRGRHKYYHYRLWYRNELSEFVGDTLLSERALSRPYLDRKYVSKIVGDHLSGKGNYTTQLTRLITCELLHTTLIDR